MNARPSIKANAFSLVEVTLSLGILSFCMVAIMGLLPIALNVTRQSMDKNIQTRILQTVRADLLQMPFSEIANAGEDSLTYAFDTEGTFIPPGSGTPAHYTATASPSRGVTLPSETMDNIVTCKVTISNEIRQEESQPYAIYLPDNGF